MTTSALVQHFFRHEYGRVVSILARRVGVQHIETIEDAVQSACMKALEAWKLSGLPDNPSAWLFRVAHNNLIANLRQQKRRQHILKQTIIEDMEAAESDPAIFMPGEIGDGLLLMLFACCDESMALESQLVLALKVLCGFDVREIAVRLFATEAKIYKRLNRARNGLRALSPRFDVYMTEPSAARLSAVHQILYLLFTEGYFSSHAEAAIRRELCSEAIRLTTILAGHDIGQTPETFALLALMHLHAARIPARQDESGGLLLLEEQDRAQWDTKGIHTGLEWLAKAAQGDRFSRYHAEAGIAAEHCLAPSFQETRWDRVVECYALLEHGAPSAIHTLNRAIAVAEWQGPAAGLALLQGLTAPDWLTNSYTWAAVLADLHQRNGSADTAHHYRELALQSAPTAAVKALLLRRLDVRRCQGENKIPGH